MVKFTKLVVAGSL